MKNVAIYIVSLLLLTTSCSAWADDRDVVHTSSSGTVVHSTSGACVRTQWSSGFDICAPQPHAAAAPVAPKPTPRIVQQTTQLTREERTIYFAFNKSSLSPDMQSRLDTLASSLRADSQVKSARIVGYADRIGNSSYNEKLSKKRAETIRQYLVAHGYVNTNVTDTRWLGSSEPATTCPSKMNHDQLITCLQPDRRVELEIDYITNVQAAR